MNIFGKYIQYGLENHLSIMTVPKYNSNSLYIDKQISSIIRSIISNPSNYFMFKNIRYDKILPRKVFKKHRPSGSLYFYLLLTRSGTGLLVYSKQLVPFSNRYIKLVWLAISWISLSWKDFAVNCMLLHKTSFPCRFIGNHLTAN